MTNKRSTMEVTKENIQCGKYTMWKRMNTKYDMETKECCIVSSEGQMRPNNEGIPSE